MEILVPVPEDADSPRFRTNIGSVHYAPEKSAIVWKIKQFGGGKEFLMRAELGLPSVKGDDEHGGGMTGGFGGSMGGAQGGKGKRPISVKFEIPYFTTSGIQVRYLKIIEPKVRPSFLFPRVLLLSVLDPGKHRRSSLVLVRSKCSRSVSRRHVMWLWETAPHAPAGLLRGPGEVDARRPDPDRPRLSAAILLSYSADNLTRNSCSTHHCLGLGT